MKICPKCRLNKRFTSFYQRKKGPRTGEYYEKCKNCMRKRGRSYYYLTREHQLELVKVRKQRYVEERKVFVYKMKDKPCSDCGVKYPPWVMDYDHREGTIKLSSIASIVSSGKFFNFNKIVEEIEKCDLVCANCHRVRTHDRIEKRKLAAVAKMVKAGV